MTFSRCAAAVAALSVLNAWPADMPVPSQPERSAFHGYRTFTQDERLPWREANDNVGRIGGWRAYAKEALAAQAADEARSRTAARPAPSSSERSKP